MGSPISHSVHLLHGRLNYIMGYHDAYIDQTHAFMIREGTSVKEGAANMKTLRSGGCAITMLVDLAFRFRGHHFLFDSVVAVAVCLWGVWAGWTELNRKWCPTTLTARSPSVAITQH